MVILLRTCRKCIKMDFGVFGDHSDKHLTAFYCMLCFQCVSSVEHTMWHECCRLVYIKYINTEHICPNCTKTNYAFPLTFSNATHLECVLVLSVSRLDEWLSTHTKDRQKDRCPFFYSCDNTICFHFIYNYCNVRLEKNIQTTTTNLLIEKQTWGSVTEEGSLTLTSHAIIMCTEQGEKDNLSYIIYMHNFCYM